jgi:4-hydroxybenzoate polyprenyltransferase
VTINGLVAALLSIGLLCALSSLTYIVNDIADLSADRQHPTKRRRPFASGALPVRQGIIAAALGIPLVLGLGVLIAPPTAFCLGAYLIATFSYSAGLKRAPILDCMIIGGLFTLRLATGIAATRMSWSAWFLTFAFAFFCSLALAKRHTELVRPGADATGPVPGRGYRYEDRSLTLTFGAAASMTSIVVLVLYLMEEAFPEGAYRQPGWLWTVPPLLFFWASRIWLISNRGEMHDDPVVFAMRDTVSLLVGACVGTAFLIAVV